VKSDDEIRKVAADLLSQGFDPMDAVQGEETAETEEDRDYFRRLFQAMQSLIRERGALDRAQLLIDEYGDAAEREGFRLAKEAAEAGDMHLEGVWLEAVPLVPLVRERGAGKAN
jgi:hypothetical protein